MPVINNSDAETEEIFFKDKTFFPELTKLSISLSCVSAVLTITDVGTDISTVFFSFQGGDKVTGYLTLFCIYLAGILALFVLDGFGCVTNLTFHFTSLLGEMKDCCICGDKYRNDNFACLGIDYRNPFAWPILPLLIILAPIVIPIKLLLNLHSEIKIYRCRKDRRSQTWKTDKTFEIRRNAERIRKLKTLEAFCEATPQSLLQMYVLGTQFEKESTQSDMRLYITIASILTSVVGLGLNIAGSWVDELTPYPVMKFKSTFMKALLYGEAVSLLIIRCALLVGSVLVIRESFSPDLKSHGLYATLIVGGFLLIPRLAVMAVLIDRKFRIRSKLHYGFLRGHVWNVFVNVISTILFYPVMTYQWTLVYTECETVFIASSILLVYFGGFGLRGSVLIVNQVPQWLRITIFLLGVSIFLGNISLRWTRVLITSRFNNRAPNDSIFMLWKHCQQILTLLEDWGGNSDARKPETEVLPTPLPRKMIQLQAIVNEVNRLKLYIEENFPKIMKMNDSKIPCGECIHKIFWSEDFYYVHVDSELIPSWEHKIKYGTYNATYGELIKLTNQILLIFILVEIDERVCHGTGWEEMCKFVRQVAVGRQQIDMHDYKDLLDRCPPLRFSDFNRFYSRGVHQIGDELKKSGQDTVNEPCKLCNYSFVGRNWDFSSEAPSSED